MGRSRPGDVAGRAGLRPVRMAPDDSPPMGALLPRRLALSGLWPNGVSEGRPMHYNRTADRLSTVRSFVGRRGHRLMAPLLIDGPEEVT